MKENVFTAMRGILLDVLARHADATLSPTEIVIITGEVLERMHSSTTINDANRLREERING